MRTSSLLRRRAGPLLSRLPVPRALDVHAAICASWLLRAAHHRICNLVRSHRLDLSRSHGCRSARALRTAQPRSCAHRGCGRHRGAARSNPGYARARARARVSTRSSARARACACACFRARSHARTRACSHARPRFPTLDRARTCAHAPCGCG